MLTRLPEGLRGFQKKGKSSEFNPQDYEQVKSSPALMVWPHEGVKDTVKFVKKIIFSSIFTRPDIFGLPIFIFPSIFTFHIWKCPLYQPSKLEKGDDSQAKISTLKKSTHTSWATNIVIIKIMLMMNLVWEVSERVGMEAGRRCSLTLSIFPHVFVYLCICVFVYFTICIFAYFAIYVFVFFLTGPYTSNCQQFSTKALASPVPLGFPFC